MMPEMKFTQKPVEEVDEYLRNLMRERYQHANTEGKILFPKKLLNEIRKETLDKLMVVAS